MSNRQKIIDAVTACKGGCGVDHIVAVTGLTRKQVNDNASQLTAAGTLERKAGENGAIYSLAGTPAPRRRGRKPGSKNRKRQAPAPASRVDRGPEADFSAAITDDSRLVIIKAGNVTHFTAEQTLRIATVIQKNFTLEEA